PGAVVPEQPDRLTGHHVEVDVPQRPEVGVPALGAPEVDEPFLQRGLSIPVDPEALGDPSNLDGGCAHSSSAKFDSSRPKTRTASTKSAAEISPTMTRLRRYQSALPSGRTHTWVPAGST